MSRNLGGNLSGVNKYGVNLDIDADEDIWSGGGDYPYPTAARIHAIVSTDADDIDAGSGAQTVEIQGLDADWQLQSEIVTMDGTDPVNTVNSYTRIFRMRVASAGATGANEGLITATAAVDGTVSARIEIGDGQTLMAIYTVPAGYLALLAGIHCTSLTTGPAGNAVIALYERDPSDGMAWRVQFRQGINQTTPVERNYAAMLPSCEGPRDLRLRAEDNSVVNMQITGEFDIVLIPLT